MAHAVKSFDAYADRSFFTVSPVLPLIRIQLQDPEEDPENEYQAEYNDPPEHPVMLPASAA